MTSEVFNTDCLEYMRTLPDKAFQLAITDLDLILSVANWIKSTSTKAANDLTANV